jgi:hypothetical protein
MVWGMGVKIDSGWASAVASTASTSAAMMWPNATPVVAAVLAIIAVIMLPLAIKNDGIGPHLRSKWSWIGLLIPIICLLYVVYRMLPVQINAQFQGVYDKYSTRLGHPTRVAINSSPTTDPNKEQWQAWTDNATIIWMRVPGIMYAFDRDSGARLTKTTDYARADPDLFDENYVRDRLKLKDSQYWPQGSLAYQLINNPEWKWVGNVSNQCKVDGSNMYYQEFEHGKIYGPFRITQKNSDLSDAVVFIIFDNGSWVREVVDADAPTVIRCLGPTA